MVIFLLQNEKFLFGLLHCGIKSNMGFFLSKSCVIELLRKANRYTISLSHGNPPLK